VKHQQDLQDRWAQYICYKLLTGMPFSNVNIPAMPGQSNNMRLIAFWLGVLLDNLIVPRQSKRPLANMWHRRANTIIHEIATSYRNVPMVVPTVAVGATPPEVAVHAAE
jgi:hypothetical protein